MGSWCVETYNLRIWLACSCCLLCFLSMFDRSQQGSCYELFKRIILPSVGMFCGLSSLYIENGWGLKVIILAYEYVIFNLPLILYLPSSLRLPVFRSELSFLHLNFCLALLCQPRYFCLSLQQLLSPVSLFRRLNLFYSFLWFLGIWDFPKTHGLLEYYLIAFTQDR